MPGSKGGLRCCMCIGNPGWGGSGIGLCQGSYGPCLGPPAVPAVQYSAESPEAFDACCYESTPVKNSIALLRSLRRVCASVRGM